MSGDRENPDRDFVCQSDSPVRCVVPVSRPDEQVFSDVHVYYHGAETDIKYVGAIRIGFFRRAWRPCPGGTGRWHRGCRD